ncbi:MAG TPA: alpha/beta fold hydrolase [Solirubrobacteraceae bacterium]|jgi:pimeloyl-ACP methyl ester carboxylesterase
MEPLFEHVTEVDGRRTRVLELEGHGPPLLLLHGYGDSADTWRPVLAELGMRDRRAVAVDLPGYGKASKLGPGAVLPQLDAFAAELVERIAAEAGEPVVVVGNSLGGALALRLGERADLPIAGIVPIAPAGLEMPRWFDLIEHDPVLRRVLALPLPIPNQVLKTTVSAVYKRLVFHHPDRIEAGVVNTFCSHHHGRAGVAALLAAGRRLLPELGPGAFDLERVAVPMLLVWGARDRMIPPSGARVILGALPDTTVELIDDCGHCPQLEAAERTVELLLGFARTRAPATAA